MHQIERYHDISVGHRVCGHESKCRFLHGHNYRVHFLCEADALDSLGRVIDFGVLKSTLCQWLEDNWDHKFLLWTEDSIELPDLGVVRVPFNPTAENMAQYLVEIVGPALLVETGVRLVTCRIDETRKCSAIYTKDSA